MMQISKCLIALFVGALVTVTSVSAAEAKAKPQLPTITFQDKPINRDGRMSASFAPVLKKTAPSVVNVYITRTVSARDMRSSPLGNLFPWLVPEEDESEAPSRRQEEGLGSGVIVSEDGYILTNNHVVEDASEVRVVLSSGAEYTAKVIGTDPPTDTAVLKIEATGLPAMVIANSDHVEVGDFAFAIGNPFSLGQTVTMGIVSAIGRGGFGIVDYEDFIQTDAAINQGNSGGALVDAEGRLIGINTFIMSRSGGNQGLGFAVPINMARGVMVRIIEDGKVRRGFLGVTLQDLNQDLAKEFNLESTKGALISGVRANTPAAGAGLKAGDVITAVNGREVTDTRHLRLMVAQTAPGTQSKFDVNRDGKKRAFTVELGELPSEELASARRNRAPQNEPEEPEGTETLEGVEVTDISPQIRRRAQIPGNVEGALVMSVDESSNAYRAGIRPGDIIQELNRKPVKSADDAVKFSEENTAERVRLRVWTRGVSRFVAVPVDRK